MKVPNEPGYNGLKNALLSDQSVLLALHGDTQTKAFRV